MILNCNDDEIFLVLYLIFSNLIVLFVIEMVWVGGVKGLSNRNICIGSLVSFPSGGAVVAEQSGDEPPLGLALGQLGGLPRLELVRVNQDGGQGHYQTVSHVQNTDDLQYNNVIYIFSSRSICIPLRPEPRPH